MPRPLDALRDTRREWMINRSRLIAALAGISLLLLVLVYRYYSLQITQHQDCGAVRFSTYKLKLSEIWGETIWQE